MLKILSSCLFLSFVWPGKFVIGAEQSTQKIWASVVNNFDLDRYLGRWYVIAHKPTFLEKDAFAATETYSKMEDGRIDVDYRHKQDSLNGRERKIPQIGELADKPNRGHMKIKFPYVPLKFDYLITELAEDYSHVVVTVPSGDYLWIMSRTPTLNEATYNNIVEGIKKLDIDLSNLRKVPQIE
jgi:apolipoprotein D and lipocalin family protein